MNRTFFPWAWMAAGIFFFSLPCHAHDPSKSYLSMVLTSNECTGQWDIPLTELQKVVAIDADKDGFLSKEELKKALESLQDGRPRESGLRPPSNR